MWNYLLNSISLSGTLYILLLELLAPVGSTESAMSDVAIRENWGVRALSR
jgi:hypothetical protein